jgi:cell wall-associated NlpC family hydrolase
MLYLAPTELLTIHAEAALLAPREMCGVLVRTGPATNALFMPCRNVALGNDEFELDASDFALAEACGEVVAIVHSHPHDDATPSLADRAGCDAGVLPWLIVAHPSQRLTWLAPWVERPPNSAQALPLLGRPFEHGVCDCYSLVRDYYFQAHGLLLHDYPRAADWWHHGGDLYRAHFAAEGFVALPAGAPLQVGDAFLIQLRSPVANHAAVYLGGDQIIHHLTNRLSGREVYGGYWAKNTVVTLRHVDLGGGV